MTQMKSPAERAAAAPPQAEQHRGKSDDSSTSTADGYESHASSATVYDDGVPLSSLPKTRDESCLPSAPSAVNSFDDMSLTTNALRGIYAYGFEKPSMVQQRAIPSIIQGRDVIAQSQSGTGKTAAFSIGLLARLDLSMTRNPAAASSLHSSGMEWRQRRVGKSEPRPRRSGPPEPDFIVRLQALVLAPTRESAQQTHRVMGELAEYLRLTLAGVPKSSASKSEKSSNSGGELQLRDVIHTYVGGTRVAEDLAHAKGRTMVAIGTPGRIDDLLRRDALSMEHLRVLVLDDGDDLLATSSGVESVRNIYARCPRRGREAKSSQVQFLLFSATIAARTLEQAAFFVRPASSSRMPLRHVRSCSDDDNAVDSDNDGGQPVPKLFEPWGLPAGSSSALTPAPAATAESMPSLPAWLKPRDFTLCRDAEQIMVADSESLLEGVRHFYVLVEEEHKLETMMDLYQSISIAQSMVFVNSRRKVDWAAEQMNKNNFPICYHHADMAMGERDKVVMQFRAGSARVLFAGDLLTRGLDVQHVNIIVNYDLPVSPVGYLHRAGRCARYGRRGVVITFVSDAEMLQLRALERYFGVEIEELPMDFASYLA